jgi:hypothetical protein
MAALELTYKRPKCLPKTRRGADRGELCEAAGAAAEAFRTAFGQSQSVDFIGGHRAGIARGFSGNFRGLLTIAEFEKRQQAEQERLRARERFETDWAQMRTAVVLPALEVAILLKKSGWQCEVRAGDKEPGVHFTVYREVKPGSAAQRPFITYQPEKQRDTVLVNVATKGSAAPLGSFGLDQITEDFVQTEATKFFAHVASEIG